VGSTSREAALCTGAASLRSHIIVRRRRNGGAHRRDRVAGHRGLRKVDMQSTAADGRARWRRAPLPTRHHDAAGVPGQSVFPRVKVLIYLGHLPLLPLRRRERPAAGYLRVLKAGSGCLLPQAPIITRVKRRSSGRYDDQTSEAPSALIWDSERTTFASFHPNRGASGSICIYVP
jgi:hypothetical protein